MPWVALGAVIIGVTLTALFAQGESDEPKLEQERGQVLSDVDTLRIAELSIHDFNDAWIACGSPDEARAAVGKGVPAWHGGGCWDTLGFKPMEPDAGYWVEVVEDRFEVHAVADLDHDGTPAEFVATDQATAHPWTDPKVF
jgi:hypothetical protein